MTVRKMLFIGDIVGKPGREAVHMLLPEIKQALGAEIVVANIENAAGGFGVTHEVYDEMLSTSIDLFTSGNHIFDRVEYAKEPERFGRVIRPANYPPGNPGPGHSIIKRDAYSLAVVNLLGRVFTATVDCPFRVGRQVVDELRAEGYRNILVDFHAETTSEKKALAYYLQGSVTAVVGTHTHVPTADNTVLQQGTAFITDVGMCGCVDGVLGFTAEPIIEKFLTQRSHRFSVPKKCRAVLQAVLISYDDTTGKAESIERVERTIEV